MTEIRIWIKRIVLLLMGLTIAHLGVTLFLLADLGSDPFNDRPPAARPISR